MPRSFKENPLYWICFSTYVDTLISNADMPMEFFVEGTRARPGKSLHPKVGLLGVAVRWVKPQCNAMHPGPAT